MTNPLDYFVSQGWTDVQAAGIVGNLVGESNLNPAAVGDSGLAYGIGQWHADRQADFASVFGRPIQGSSLDDQLAFVQWELQNKGYLGGSSLKNAYNVSDATSIFMNKYERPANNSSFQSRLNAAKDALAKGGNIIAKIGNFLNTPIGAGVGDNATGNVGSSDCGTFDIICKLKAWLDQTHFFQRVAIVILALIVIGGALYMLATKTNINVKGLKA